MPWYFGNNGFMGTTMMGWARWGIVPFLFWSLAWKGLALWHAARRNDRPWFVGLLVINTLGILEIVYLLFVVRLFRETKKPAGRSSGKRKR